MHFDVVPISRHQVSPLVTSFVDGFNVCVLAYGQTGSGKTFTMLGPSAIDGESAARPLGDRSGNFSWRGGE